MSHPIDSYEVDIIMSRELPHTESQSDATNNTSITLDNTFNIERDPIITITAKSAITSLVITNTTNSRTVTLPSLSNNDVVTVKSMAAYKSGVELSTAIYSSPFKIVENSENVLTFTTNPTDATFDVSIQWTKASSNYVSTGYSTSFNFSDSRNGKTLSPKFLGQYSQGQLITNVDLKFTVAKMWFDSDILDDDINMAYQIKYITNSDIKTINQQVIVLCGCKLNQNDWERQEDQIITQNLSGFVTKRFVGNNYTEQTGWSNITCWDENYIVGYE